MENITREEPSRAPAINFKGQSRESVDASRALMFAFGLSLLIVFLVLSAQFESLVHPFTIMLTVPLAVAGVLGGLYLTEWISGPVAGTGLDAPVLQGRFDPLTGHGQLQHPGARGVMDGRGQHAPHADYGRFPAALGGQQRVGHDNGFDPGHP